jgi:uncharacterized protein
MVRRITLVALLLSVLASPTIPQTNNTTNEINLLLSKLPPSVETKRYKNFTPPRFKEVSVKSLYLPMRDGVKIAVTLVLPNSLAPNEKIPAVMSMTRYWRGKQGEQPNTFFPAFGYAAVLVDARGTGASYGVWKAPFSADEIKDYNEVVNWIVSQPWSNGKVGATGNSYTGNTALWLATLMNPAVKAVVARHYEFDLFAETPYPGGLLTDWLIKTWNDGNRELDTNPGVRLIDDDADQTLYKGATARRSENMNVYAAALSTTFRDDRTFGSTLDELSLHSYTSQIEKSGVALNNWGGWFDASTADAVIKTFMTLKNYQRAIIGPWNHGGGQNASPYRPAEPERVMLQFELLRFLDHHLKSIDTGLDSEKLLYYFTIGEEKWKVTNTWPVAGTKMTRWYFDANNVLSQNTPKADGEDRYTINFEASTGAKNRWHTQVGGEVVYPDRANEDKKLLTYTSAPLEADLEITGYPIISLFATSTHPDGGFYVYLEDVDENGKVTYLTEGALRGLHHRVSTEQPPIKIFVPYHTFKKKDGSPLIPGEVAEIRFGLQPISALIKKNHRLRVAIAGHDKETFIRVPVEGSPTIAVQRNKRGLSSIELPIVKR